MGIFLDSQIDDNATLWWCQAGHFNAQFEYLQYYQVVKMMIRSNGKKAV